MASSYLHFIMIRGLIMDTKVSKGFSNNAKYELNEMLSLINDQTLEIDFLHDKLDDITLRYNGKIALLEEEIGDLIDSSPDCPTEEIEFEGYFHHK